MKYEKCWCGSNKYYSYAQFKTKVLRKDSVKIRIVKCSNCGTVRMFDNGLSEVPNYETAYNYEMLSGRHIRTISIINKYHVGESILDIGCNTGILLNEIRLQIPSLKRLKGVDLDSNAIIVGREKYGLDIEAVDASKLTDKYDNIVLCHTLEHVEDLAKFAELLDRLLNPGGKIFISVPNIESLNARYFLRFWPALSPEFHLWYFSKHSIQLYFNKLLPKYQQILASSYFIWKPLIFPSVYWRFLKGRQKTIQKLEYAMKGDQLNFVISKPKSE